MQSKRSMPLGVRAKCALVWMAAVLLTALAWTEGAQAQTGVCIKTVTAAPAAVDGVVAPGTATGACASDDLWAGVVPAQFQPLGSPDGRLYFAYYTSGGTRHLRIGVDVKGDEDVSDFDVVSLFFDANNNNVWDAGDFMLQVKVSPSTSVITTGEFCNQPAGTVTYYQRVGSSWSSAGTAAAAAAVGVKYAYDYSSTVTDPETKIWNLEIDIPIGFTSGGNTYFNLTTTGPDYFGIGGYVFADYNHQQTPQLGTVLKWPGSITATPGIADSAPAFYEPDVTQLANASLEDKCFDVNFSTPTPWVINGSPANPNDYRVKRYAVNDFRVTYYFDGPGLDATPLSNPGTVKLTLTPHRASGFGNTWTKTFSILPDSSSYNTEITADFSFDFTKPDPSFGSTADMDFVCADLTLENFLRDDDQSNNHSHNNLNFFQTSEYRQQFRLFGSSVPNLKPGETAKIFLAANMTNELPELQAPPLVSASCLIYFLVALAILLLIAFILKSRGVSWKTIVAILALLLIAAIVLAMLLGLCRKPIGTGRWTVTNADQIGLEAVSGRPGWYQTTIKKDEVKTVDLLFRGEKLPYTTQRQQLEPAAKDGLNRLEIPVKPKSVVTVIAFGEVDVDGDGPLPPTTAAGTVEKQVVTGKIANAATGDYLLRRGRYQPNQYAGALIGSFDDFKTSFVVGRYSSIVVPAGAEKLKLAVNARMGTFAVMKGAYDIYTVATEAPSVPTHTAFAADATYNIPPKFNLWDVLTSLNVYTYYQTETVRDGVVRGRNLHPWGDAHYSIYASHADEQALPAGVKTRD